MRDDISDLVILISTETEKKIELLREFLARERELNSILKTDFDNEPVAILDSENSIITQINMQDYKISQLNDLFQKKTGMSLSSCSTGYKETGIIAELQSIRSRGKKIISEIAEIRKINLELMEHAREGLKKDADEIRRIIELNIDYPKDLQSS